MRAAVTESRVHRLHCLIKMYIGNIGNCDALYSVITFIFSEVMRHKTLNLSNILLNVTVIVYSLSVIYMLRNKAEQWLI